MKKYRTTNLQYLLYFVIIFVVFALALTFFSRLVEPKYISYAREGNLISEYYAEVDSGRRHDVVMIGDCEAYSAFVPPVLYEKYGIRSFVRGSPSQSVAQSYFLLCETLKYEKPRAVVFSVYALSKEEKPPEPYNRMTLDGMRMSREKVLAVRASMNGGESMASYFLPLLRFHSRIFELEGEDFRYIFDRPKVSHNGYFLETAVVPGGELSENDGEVGSIPSENLAYLEAMADLCRESGVELILVKTPISSWRYPWSSETERELARFAESKNLSYYNLIEVADEIGIDLSRDTYDGGLHLNVYGAEKVTAFFGAILSEKHDINGERNNAWDEKVDRYYNEKDAGETRGRRATFLKESSKELS